jgi:hypothetical protein
VGYLSTPFSDIFTKFLKLLTDRDIVVDLTDEELTDLLFGFLDQSMSLYFKNCETDLTDYEDYDYYSQTFTATGSSVDFIISQYPTSPNADGISYVVTVDGTATTAFTFTASTKTYHLTSMPTVGQIVICSYEFSGQFNETLTSEEQWVLAHGMMLGWLSEQMYNPLKMKERLSTKDWNSPHSPANLLKELQSLYDRTERNLRNLVVSYSFNSGYNFDEE